MTESKNNLNSSKMNIPRDLPNLTPSKRDSSESPLPTPAYPYPTLEEICREVGIDLTKARIIDTHYKAGLVMIGYSEDLSLPGNLQGSIWARVKNQTVMVMTSHSYPKDIISHTLSIGYDQEGGENTDNRTEGVTYLKTDDGTEKYVGVVPICATIGVEGLFVRLGRFRGYDLFANRRKIDSSESRWGDANYIDEFKKTCPYNHDDLFEDTHTSNISYAFMITTPLTITGTRQDLKSEGAGYCTLLSVDFNWNRNINCFSYDHNDPEDREYAGSQAFPRFVEGIEYDPECKGEIKCNFKGEKIRIISYDDFPGSPDGNLGLIAPVQIPFEEIETFLQWGYYNPLPQESTPDHRLYTGEAVIVNIQGNIYKIMHPSFEWRNRLRRNEKNISGDPKLRNPFYRAVISNFKNQKEHDEWFLQMDTLPHETIKTHLDKGYSFIWAPHCDTSNIYEHLATNVDERRRVAFCNFVLSAPIHTQIEVLKYWSELKPSLNRLTQFIIGLQKDLFYFIDVSKESKMVTRLSTKEESTEEWIKKGFRVERGANRWYYVFKNVRIPKNKYFVLLNKPHPASLRIKNMARAEAARKSEHAVGDAKRKYSKWNHGAINRLIDNSTYNEVYQMVRQLDAVEQVFFR